METQQVTEETQTETAETAHPWLEVPECSLDEDLRFTLDEIRIV